MLNQGLTPVAPVAPKRWAGTQTVVLISCELLEMRWSSSVEARCADLGLLCPWSWVPATRLPPPLRTSAFRVDVFASKRVEKY